MLNRTINIALILLFSASLGTAEVRNTKDLYTADKQLHQAYRELRQSRTPKARKTLLRTQKAWLRKRDKTCKLKGLPTNHKAWLKAVAKDNAKSQCVIQLIQDRVARLRANRMTPASVVFTHDIQKKYPPYPAVWGYLLPLPEKYSDYSLMRFYFAKNGDIHFTFVEQQKVTTRQLGTKPCDQEKQYAYFEFFGAKTKRITCAQYEVFEKGYVEDARSSSYSRITFKNGSRILTGFSGGGNCYYPLSPYLMKKNPSGKTVFRKTLLYLAEVPAIHRTNPYCGVEGGKVIAKLIATGRTRYIDLGDGTFLFLSADNNYVIRFDQNLRSKSPLLGTRLFLVNTDRIDAMRKQSIIDAKENTLKSYQLLHKRVYDYVLDLKRRGRYGD